MHVKIVINNIEIGLDDPSDHVLISKVGNIHGPDNLRVRIEDIEILKAALTRAKEESERIAERRRKMYEGD